MHHIVVPLQFQSQFDFTVRSIGIISKEFVEDVLNEQTTHKTIVLQLNISRKVDVVEVCAIILSVPYWVLNNLKYAFDISRCKFYVSLWYHTCIFLYSSSPPLDVICSTSARCESDVYLLKGIT
jgi:hypothetical protein